MTAGGALYLTVSLCWLLIFAPLENFTIMIIVVVVVVACELVSSLVTFSTVITEPQTALCGNGVVEEGEECDCGWAEDCAEECCWPQRTEFPPNERPCTLRPNKVCSPTQV